MAGVPMLPREFDGSCLGLILFLPFLVLALILALVLALVLAFILALVGPSTNHRLRVDAKGRQEGSHEWGRRW